ncbi:hypothetical protein [Gordonia lacunae]|uniref:Uncharacterized protein n=1 Tax=Gordonia lacunae TaxID=417102 RepID=A0A243QFC1_9ACTN|nr:hypothetical protein [Gordonia lacunae]OUC80423.1 hypothetical protein CA982_04370 [Gordonia lacunae]
MSTSLAAIRVGARTESEPAIAADVLDEHGLTAPAGSQSLGIMLAELLTGPAPHGERVGLTWTTSARLTRADRARVRTVVTRVAHDGLDRHVEVVDEAGRVRESGVETWQTATRPNPITALDFCGIEWATDLQSRLHRDEAFTSSVSTWDGTIGLRSGAREVHLRIYKGQVIDVTRRSLLGATFTFEARPETWVELILGADDDFMRRALRGEFSSAGNGYEYLRLTRPLHTIMHHARAMAQEVPA